MDLKRIRWLCIVSSVSLTPGLATGQDRAVFTTSSDLVVLHATVTDRRGGFVSGLTRDNFLVLEDGRPQRIAFFGEQDSPVTVGLVVDSSGSMLQNRALIVAAAEAFAKASHPEDEFFAMVFNERVRPVLPRGSRFTSEPTVLRDALASHLAVRGRTALHDALSAALAELGHGTRDRKVLIVVGDGGDNASRTTFEQALATAQASNVVIYTVALVDRLDYDSNPKRLRRLASATGGLAFEPPNGARVEEAFRQISRDIRSSYTLAYAPTDPTRDGRLHRIEVRVYTADGSRHLARTRSGYLALTRSDEGTGQ